MNEDDIRRETLEGIVVECQLLIVLVVLGLIELRFYPAFKQEDLKSIPNFGSGLPAKNSNALF